MSTLSVRLPASLHRQLKGVAVQEGVSMNQMISAAVGEKLAALLTAEYLQARARRGSRRRFDAVLRRVRNVAPVKGDELPNKRMQLTRAATAGRRSPRS
jgi:hypothetical protein